MNWGLQAPGFFLPGVRSPFVIHTGCNFPPTNKGHQIAVNHCQGWLAGGEVADSPVGTRHTQTNNSTSTACDAPEIIQQPGFCCFESQKFRTAEPSRLNSALKSGLCVTFILVGNLLKSEHSLCSGLSDDECHLNESSGTSTITQSGKSLKTISHCIFPPAVSLLLKCVVSWNGGFEVFTSEIWGWVQPLMSKTKAGFCIWTWCRMQIGNYVSPLQKNISGGD